MDLRVHSTGSVRDSRRGKGRMDLIPPEPLLLMAKHLELGAEKYGDRNWEKGQPVSWYIDSGFRHLMQYMRGDTNEDHLVSAFVNMAMALATRERIRYGTLPDHLMDTPRGPEYEFDDELREQMRLGRVAVQALRIMNNERT